MDINEARAVLGVTEYAELEEINVANDKNIECAFETGDLGLLRRSARAVAELLVESKRFTRLAADQFIKSQDEFIDGAGARLDQNLAVIRQLKEREQQLRFMVIDDIDIMHRAEEIRNRHGKRLAEAEAQYEAARATLIAQEVARIKRRDARVQKLKRLFSFFTLRK